MTGLMLKTSMLYDEFIRTLFRSIWPLLIHTLLYRCEMFHEYELGYGNRIIVHNDCYSIIVSDEECIYEEQDTTTCNNLDLFHMKLCFVNRFYF